MKIYLEQNVYNAAIERINRVFDTFDTVFVSSSGGKDSTVVMNLALKVAEEKNRLPLKVVWLDQEAEWQSTIDYMSTLKDDPRIDFDWLQIPFRIFNSSSSEQDWLSCWDPSGDWMREKDRDSIHENVYGTDRFAELLEHYQFTTFPDGAVTLTGMRAQESPVRFVRLTRSAIYEDITWGAKTKKKNHFRFHPIFDWEISDVWKAIYDNGWTYNRLYDYLYQYGVKIKDMRVSSLTHETALKNLHFMQEVDPESWEKITNRLTGINTVNQLGSGFWRPKELPFMFASWKEYRDHLLETLIDNPEIKEKLQGQFNQTEDRYIEAVHKELFKVHIDMILTNDYHGTKLALFTSSNAYFRKEQKAGIYD